MVDVTEEIPEPQMGGLGILDDEVEHDPRSDNWLVGDVIPAQTPVKKIWKAGPTLNQHQTGMCVAFALTAELIAKPKAEIDVPVDVAEAYAVNLWKRTRYTMGLDVEDVHGGTRPLPAFDILKARGLIDEYRWAKSIGEVRDAVIAEGPVCVTIGVHTSMLHCDNRTGYIDVDVMAKTGWFGMHEFCVVGYDPNHFGSEAFLLRNSWGTNWGELKSKWVNHRKEWYRTGSGWMRASDLSYLLARSNYNGVAVVPMGRQKVDLAANLAANPDYTVS